MAAAYDGTTAKIRTGMSSFGFLEFKMPDESVKTEVFSEIGEMYKLHRTTGMVELGEASGKMRVETWARWLTKLPDDFTEAVFHVTITDRHSRIQTPYSAILHECRITGHKRSIENSEKRGEVEIPMSVLYMVHNGGTGWKALGRLPGQQSAAALALQF